MPGESGQAGKGGKPHKVTYADTRTDTYEGGRGRAGPGGKPGPALTLPHAVSALRKDAGASVLATLSLSARVYLRLCLPLPPDLAAALIQAWWRGFALRQVLPAMIVHAHRVCGIVERHRKRLLQELHQPPPRAPHSPPRPAAQDADTAAHAHSSLSSSSHTPSRMSPASRNAGLVDGGSVIGYATPHAQEALKRHLALAWSTKRITYPLALDLRDMVVCVVCVPYMYALYVCLICMRCMCALYVCVVCVPYMCALYVVRVSAVSSDTHTHTHVRT